MMQTDLLIIGAGPGGYRAAEYAAQQGLQVVIIEEAEVGGTCLNRGCIPTKTYVHSATFAEAVERQQQVVAQLRSGVESILSHPNITLLRGHAAFVDGHTVQVMPAAGSQLPSPVTFDILRPSPLGEGPGVRLILATGSTAKLPPIADINDPRVVTSTELLQMTQQPRRLAIIGAGVIGMEFASIFHRFGSEVIVIEFLKECLPMLDSDIAKRLRKLMEKQGILFKMKTAVQQLSDVDADTILIATGRQPNTKDLNLTALGIATNTNGYISVDDNFYVGDGLYAIGDVNGRQLLAHAAEMQAVRAVNHIIGRTDTIRFDIMPAAIFTSPEAASVGPTEDHLRDVGMDYRCRKSFWRANGKAMAMDETEGMLKLFSASDDRILGCHAYGSHASDIIQEVAALMCRDTTISQLRDIIHIHPTLSEILHSAVQNG